jgi:hypothetical protein
LDDIIDDPRAGSWKWITDEEWDVLAEPDCVKKRMDEGVNRRPMRKVRKTVSRMNELGEAITEEIEEEVTDEEDNSIYSR